MNRQEAKEKRIELLQQMGFEIAHEHSSVFWQGVEFDFSAIAPNLESIAYHAMTTMFAKGQAVGKAIIQESMKDLLGIDK